MVCERQREDHWQLQQQWAYDFLWTCGVQGGVLNRDLCLLVIYWPTTSPQKFLSPSLCPFACLILTSFTLGCGPALLPTPPVCRSITLHRCIFDDVIWVCTGPAPCKPLMGNTVPYQRRCCHHGFGNVPPVTHRCVTHPPAVTRHTVVLVVVATPCFQT